MDEIYFITIININVVEQSSCVFLKNYVQKNIQTYIAIKITDLGMLDENGSSIADATFQQAFFQFIDPLNENQKLIDKLVLSSTSMLKISCRIHEYLF